MSKQNLVLIFILIMALFAVKNINNRSEATDLSGVIIKEHTLPLSVENATTAFHENWRISMSNVTLYSKTNWSDGSTVVEFWTGSKVLNILLTAKDKAKMPRECDLTDMSVGDKVNIIIIPKSLTTFKLSYINKQTGLHPLTTKGMSITEAEFRSKYADYLEFVWISLHSKN